MKYTILILFFIFLFSNNSQGQSMLPDENIGKLRILPPSIENYQFTEYGNLTLNNNQGGFSYSVPVYKIVHGPLTLPISLDYFTTGVKVNDIAGIVGMNWNLNAGGMITRIIKGEPDEKTNVVDFRISKSQMMTTLSGNYTPADYTNIHEQRLKNIYNSARRNPSFQVNHEQDWFSFNFNNISGSFYIHDGEIYINSQQSDIKGELIKTISVGGPVLEFQFTLPNGIQYTFGGGNTYSEKSEVSSNCQRNYEKAFPTTWYIKNIHYNGWNVDFIYEENLKRYPLSYYEEYNLTKRPTNLPSDFNHFSEECIFQFESIDAKYLKRIEFGESKIEFNYLNQRADYYSGKILNSIDVKHKNILKKNVHFDYDFSTSSGYTGVVNSDVVKHRAFLDKITINNDKEFSFEYNNIDGLPPRLSYKQDLYGYANSNNFPALINVLHPYFYDGYSNLFKERFNDLVGADRNVDEDKSLYGVLTKIIYPTKGRTEIEYENNTTFRNKSVMVGNTETVRVEDFNCEVSNYPKSDVFQFVGNGSKIFVTAHASVWICDYEDYHDIHTLTITNESKGTILFSGSVGMDRDFIGDGSIAPPYNNSHEFHPITTEDGDTYRIEYEVNSNFNDVFGLLNIEYNLEKNHVWTEFNYSAARVKSVKDFTINNNLSTSRSYVYNTKDSLNAQSTSLRHKYFFTPWRYETLDLSDLCQGSCGMTAFNPNSYTVSSENQIIALNSRFNRINYKAISVVSDNGIVEKIYNVNPITSFGTDIIINSVDGPTKSNHSEWSENQLEQITFFKKNTIGLYARVKMKKFYYSLIREESFNNYNFMSGITPMWELWQIDDGVLFNHVYWEKVVDGEVVYTDWGCTTLFCNITGKIGVHYYKNFVYHSKLIKEVQTEYFDNGDEITTSIDYEFSSPFHLQPTHTETTTSENNETLVTKMYYPHDLPGEPFANELISANRISIPLKTESYRKENGVENLLKTKKIQYFYFPNGLILPQYIKIAKGNDFLENRITYNSYDNYGNPTEILKTNGISVSYIWGYDHQYPIAKIENQDFSTIPTSLITSVQNASNTGSEAQLNAALDNLRNALPNAMVTTYTYNPLIGITSETSPRGYTTSYEYDEFSRLEFIKDDDQNVLKTFHYNYRD